MSLNRAQLSLWRSDIIKLKLHKEIIVSDVNKHFQDMEYLEKEPKIKKINFRDNIENMLISGIEIKLGGGEKRVLRKSKFRILGKFHGWYSHVLLYEISGNFSLEFIEIFLDKFHLSVESDLSRENENLRKEIKQLKKDNKKILLLLSAIC